MRKYAGCMLQVVHLMIKLKNWSYRSKFKWPLLTHAYIVKGCLNAGSGEYICILEKDLDQRTIP